MAIRDTAMETDPPAPERAAEVLLLSWKVFRRAVMRVYEREAMLYVGGISFFALLAIFPTLGILAGLYGLIFSPEQAAAQVAAVAGLMPESAKPLIENQLVRLAYASRSSLSIQSLVALLVAVYASHRGFKALLAGLSLLHEEANPRGIVKFNFLALLVAIAALGLFMAVSVVFLALQMASFVLSGHRWIVNIWLWAAIALPSGLTLLYHYAMSRDPVPWRASIGGGVVAAALCLFASWLCAVYVNFASTISATYGSIGAVVVLLIWLSWNVNAVLIGGSLATEIERVLKLEGKLGPVNRGAFLNRLRRYKPRAAPVGEER